MLLETDDSRQEAYYTEPRDIQFEIDEYKFSLSCDMIEL